MLKIRPEQMEVFQPIADAAFVRRLAEYVQQEHADSVVQLPTGRFTVEQIPDEILHEMVRNGIARARGYGLSWESSLSTFVIIMFMAAPNFDEHPLIQRVLRDEKVPPDSRIAQLWEQTTEQNWEAVKQNYDIDSWNLRRQEDEQ